MNFRTTFILGGIFLALLLLLAVAISIGPENGDQGRALFPELLKATGVDVNPSENIVGLRVERSRPEVQALVLKRGGQTRKWSFEQPFQGAADSFAVNNLVRAVLEGRREEDRDAKVADEQTGLSQPVARVTLTDKDGKEHSLVVGKSVPGAAGNLAFVLASGRGSTPQVMLERDLEPLFRAAGALRERSLLGAETDIEQFQLSSGPQGAKPAVGLRKAQGAWKYETPAYGMAGPASAAAQGGAVVPEVDTGAILKAIASLRVEQVGERVGERNDFIAEGVKDLAAYGLDAAKNRVLRVEVERAQVGGEGKPSEKTGSGANRVVLLVGLDKQVEKPSDNPVEKPGEKGLPFKGFQATIEGTGSVVLVPGGPVNDLVRLLDDPGLIRDRAVLRLSGEPDWIEINNGLGRMELVRADLLGGYKLFRPGVAEGQAVDLVAVNSLLEAMKNARGRFVEDNAAKRAELELNKPADQQVSVRLWTAGVDKGAAEKETKKEDKLVQPSTGKPVRKETAPVAEVVLGRRLGEEAALLRVMGNDQAVLMVPKALLDVVEQGPLAYLDRKVPSFAGESVAGEAALDAVTGVSLAKGAETLTVSRKDKSELWKFSGPKGRESLPVDAQVIRALLVNLNALQARKLVVEKPTSQQLVSQGLEPAAMSLTVNLTGADGKPLARVFSLGKESGDGGIFAKASWVDRVFTVDLSLRAIMETPWENRQLFSGMDLAKVNRLKLTGWQSVNGVPLNLVLEKENDQWAAKDPATDFPVAQEKVTQLLQNLKMLRFEKVMAYSGGGDPGLGLDPSKSGLAIEWNVTGQKDPVRLNLGRVEGAGLAAAVTTLPGMVVVVPKAPFEEVLQGRGKFRR